MSSFRYLDSTQLTRCGRLLDMAGQYVEPPIQADDTDDYDHQQADLIGARKDSMMDVEMPDMTSDYTDSTSTTPDDMETTTASLEPADSTSWLGDTPVSGISSSEDTLSSPTIEPTSSEAEPEASKNPSTAVAESALDTAVQKVFATYELIEHFFLNLPKLESRESMKTILLAQRVSKTFHHVIQRSVKLQQVLFFKPSPMEEKARVIPVHLLDVRWNSLLERPYVRANTVLSLRGGFMHIDPQGPGHSTWLSLPSKLSRQRQDTDASLVVESWERMLLGKETNLEGELRVAPRLPRNWEIDALTIKRDCTMGKLWEKVLKNRKLYVWNSKA